MRSIAPTFSQWRSGMYAPFESNVRHGRENHSEHPWLSKVQFEQKFSSMLPRLG